ncbi:MAG: hypothetical protein RIC95_05900 [Vicingaceae bacterium]
MDKDLFKAALSKDEVAEGLTADFTSSVMEKVEHAAENPSQFEPLVPKRIRILIGLGYLAICLLPIILGMQESALAWMDQLHRLGVESSDLKQTLKFISLLGFVFAALTLTDMLVKRGAFLSIKPT